MFAFQLDAKSFRVWVVVLAQEAVFNHLPLELQNPVLYEEWDMKLFLHFKKTRIHHVITVFSEIVILFVDTNLKLLVC